MQLKPSNFELGNCLNDKFNQVQSEKLYRDSGTKGKQNQNLQWKLRQQTPSAGTLYVYIKSIRQQIEKIEMKIVWMSWNWGFSKFFFKQMLKVSVFNLEKYKSFISKRYDLVHSL